MLRIEDQSSRTADSTVLNARDAFIGNFLEKMVEFWKDDEREKRDLVLIWIRYKVARLRRGLEKKKAVRKFIKGMWVDLFGKIYNFLVFGFF